jgi:hypothetical protein
MQMAPLRAFHTFPIQIRGQREAKSAKPFLRQRMNNHSIPRRRGILRTDPARASLYGDLWAWPGHISPQASRTASPRGPSVDPLPPRSRISLNSTPRMT